MKTYLFLLVYLSSLLTGVLGFATEYENVVVIEKKNVLHTFALIDDTHNSQRNHFIRHYFIHWENDTFDVFDQVKNPEAIAIDLGAWFGTTAIWLAKNFYHVIAVEGDRLSTHYLRKNLKLSGCPNTSICGEVITKDGRDVIFGGRSCGLNESISCVKDQETKDGQLLDTDYETSSISFKQLLNEYYYSNPLINSRRITFLKCDIEGGEEEILEDLLKFAYENQSTVHMSFHYSWWKEQNIKDFEGIFNLFKTNSPEPTVSDAVILNPFITIVFEPKGY